MRAWADVATLAKTKSLKGRFVARHAANLPFIVPPGCEVAFVPPRTDVPRRALVKDAMRIDHTRYEVQFEGIDDSVAEELVGCHLLVKRELLEESSVLEQPASWEGWSACDQTGAILGRIERVVDNPGQMLLEIERADGEGKLLVPLVEDFLNDVDVEGRRVSLTLPDGLLDL